MAWFNRMNIQPKLLLTYALFLMLGTVTVVQYTGQLNGIRSDVEVVVANGEDVQRMLLIRALFTEQHLMMTHFAQTGSEEAMAQYIVLQDRISDELQIMADRIAAIEAYIANPDGEATFLDDAAELETMALAQSIGESISVYYDTADPIVTLYDEGAIADAQEAAQAFVNQEDAQVLALGEAIEDFELRRQADITSQQLSINETSRTGIIIGMFLIGGLFVLGVFSSFVTTNLTEPLTYLTNAIFAFENDQYETDLIADYLSRGDEVGTLATSFDMMVANITEANQERDRLLTSAQRFVPQPYLEFLEKQSVEDLQLGDHIAARMSVMFSDIRGFTTMSEGMTPAENFDFVNRYLREVSPLIQRYNGFVVKFLGDGMMAIFPYDVEDALRAAIAKQRTSQSIGQALGAQINLGVGIHIGDMMVGMIGEERRLQGDAFSDNVNLTARIEGLNKTFGTSILISEEARERLNEPEHYAMRRLGKVQVKGREAPITLYEVFEGMPGEDIKMASRSRFYEGLALYDAGQFAQAQQVFKEVLDANPDDRTAAFYVEQTAYLQANPPQGEWQGVIVMTSK